ncbi:ankyrin repeat domain-containing protein 17-like isoform X4 [Homalodisca vitripennis]|nr:ankyrin repeat domain-containing protein 17-like isoform X4 [Homalodisca vitripennis]
MQNVAQGSTTDNQKLEKLSGQEVGKSSTPQSSNSSPTKSETDTFSELQPRFMSDSSDSEDEDVSEVESFVIDNEELVDEPSLQTSKFLLSPEDNDHSVDPETQARLEALLQAAGIGKLAAGDGKHLADPEVLRRLTSSVSCALDEAAAALTRMRSENPRPQQETRSLAEACSDGDVGTVRKLLTEGRSVHETTEEGESLLSLACSAGYYELAQVLLAMHANVEDRGIKGDCTPLMEAASAGFVEIVRLLIAHGADVNAQSSSGNTPLMYACAGGHEHCVRVLLEAGANVEDHNENGHTPLMEAASAGHVTVAKILLEHGAGINTHSNEFKESALTLACYKGHLDMVRFLLEAGADQEHKTDEMHTALMEASMDGHVEVAKLLLDSGAQVNMPTDSFESPLTLAACGGHVDLALLLIERGANIEEVNDEGYTPLMEAAREGHEEMVSVLLNKGANINAQTEETQETALTLACCGGFLEVADYLIKHGAELELGASTPLMEAAQEGHLDLVRYLLEARADVHAQTQTGDTALTYACENGHTDVADLLIQYGANLEHESEGGRTPLMKACRAGHLCTVQFLISKSADVNRQTTNNDHTPLSLACAGGHLSVVELLLAHSADPFHKLKDNSTMLIEAAKGGHTNVVQLLLDYPHSIMMSPPHPPAPAPAPTGLHEVPEAVRVLPQEEPFTAKPNTIGRLVDQLGPSVAKHNPPQKSLLRKNRLSAALAENSLTSPEVQQVRNAPGGEVKDDPNMLDKGSTKPQPLPALVPTAMEQQIFQKQQLVEEFQRVEQELKEQAVGCQLLESVAVPSPSFQQMDYIEGLMLGAAIVSNNSLPLHNSVFKTETVQTSPAAPAIAPAPTPHLPISASADVSQTTAISDRPKAKPVSKKEGKNMRKQQVAYQAALQQQQNQAAHLKHLAQINEQLQQQVLHQQQQMDQQRVVGAKNVFTTNQLMAHIQQLEPLTHHKVIHQEKQIRTLQQEGVCCPSCDVLPQRCQLLPGDETKPDQTDVLVESLETFTLDDVTAAGLEQARMRELAAAAYAAGEVDYARGAEAALEMLTKSRLQVLGTDQDQVEYFMPSPSGPVQVQGGPNSFQVQYQVTRQELQQLSEMKARQAVNPSFPSQSLLLQNTPLMVPGSGVESGGIHQVVAATQTTPDPKKPAPAPAPAPSPAPAPTPTTKGKKQSRYQLQQRLQAATSSPPHFQLDTNPSPPFAGNEVQFPQAPPFSCMDVDSETDSNHDTALTLACAGGHEELVELLLSRGATIEHRDKKGFTPLILAATAGHEKVVEILMNHAADMEAQSERTKDTPLSLACSGGRYEVVDLLLNRGANKEHRNVSDYTPLSLAASGGYVNIIKLLLTHGAEINSRTGSKLGISPLMLAAMNGHTAAVKLLLDMGSDINAQIETNRNTALTLACFQGRHEVVSLLLDRKANVEHRAKTGLTPLMEAASGGYVEVGRVLLDKGADVNAPPVPSSRDTALTIAADKGHCRFVELLLQRNAQVEVKNKKGNSPLWLAANGGHLAVVELLYSVGADIDSQDNRKVSCLMAAFRKGHMKVVKWMVNHVTQFPSDQEMSRYISTINDKELLEKCQDCVKIIRVAKDQQAAKANKNATILLEELDMEKNREESKRAAAARRRERKKKKKLEKKEEKRKLHEENQKNEMMYVEEEEDDEEDEKEEVEEAEIEKAASTSAAEVTLGEQSPARGGGEGEEGDSGIDANSQGSCSSNEVKPVVKDRRKEKKKKKPAPPPETRLPIPATSKPTADERRSRELAVSSGAASSHETNTSITSKTPSTTPNRAEAKCGYFQETGHSKSRSKAKGQLIFEASRHPAEREDFEATGNETYVPISKGKRMSYLNAYSDGEGVSSKGSSTVSPKQPTKREEGWREVVRKYLNSPFRSKKVSVPLNAISRVIGRGGSNINAIRCATGAHIEVEKQSKGQGERIITIKGSTEATRQAHNLIAALIKDPEVDILTMLPKATKQAATATWDKSAQNSKSKSTGAKTSSTSSTSTSTVSSATTAKPSTSAEKRAAQLAAAGNTKTTMSYTTAIMTSSRASKTVTTTPTPSQTFAAKLTAEVTVSPAAPPTPQLSPAAPTPAPAAIPTTTTPQPLPLPPATPTPPLPATTTTTTTASAAHSATLEYSLFNDTFTKVAQQSMWGRENDPSQKGMNFASVAATGAPANGPQQLPNMHTYLESSPPQVDAAKAPGYRGTTVCSPVSSKSSTTPPSLPSLASYPSYSPPTQSPAQYTRVYAEYQPEQTDTFHYSQSLQQATTTVTMSRLNPRAPDFRAPTTSQPPIYNPNPPTPTPAPAPYILANNNIISFPLSKFTPQQPRPNGQTQRWSYITPHAFPQPQDVVGFTNAHLATLASLGHQDVLAGLENGAVGSPNVSPSSPQQAEHRPMDDRKVPPRPIGTERAWKNYTGMNTVAEPDVNTASWLWTAAAAGGNLSALERHQMYRSQGPTPAFARLVPDEMPTIIDTTAYQGGADSQHYNGCPPGTVLQSAMPLLPQYDMVPPDGLKLEAPWDHSRLPMQDLQDKQHGWNKWNH